MKLNRRRFLMVMGAFAASPAQARRHSWSGRAFGAEVSITLRGPSDRARPALEAARARIREVEQLFNLYDPTSDLVRLNQTGHLAAKSRFLDLMRAADRAHALTAGLFDPTVQPLWKAMRDGGDLAQARRAVGWDRVSFGPDGVRLAPGQALTFNGIAQGFATDLVTEVLTAHGATETLVNIGEYRGVGGPWRLGVADPRHGLLATRSIRDGAIATSSPMATPLGEKGHILHPDQTPIWSTVSVEAETATLADALSTALVFAPRDQVRDVKEQAGLGRVILVDDAGDLSSL